MLQTFEREKALKTFGGNVRRERTFHRITQEKLAKLAQLNVRTIAKIEAGELNIRSETIGRIQQAIGCALSRLIDSNANRSPNQKRLMLHARLLSQKRDDKSRFWNRKSNGGSPILRRKTL
jgi:transcriptional regulator with XRE-family HTH domain